MPRTDVQCKLCGHLVLNIEHNAKASMMKFVSLKPLGEARFTVMMCENCIKKLRKREEE